MLIEMGYMFRKSAIIFRNFILTFPQKTIKIKNWSRLHTTTAKTHDKSQYIYLKNPSKEGKQIKMRRSIITGTISKRLNRAKNRPKLEASDMKKIKAFINKELEKNK